MSLRAQFEAMHMPELADIPYEEPQHVFDARLAEVRRQFPSATDEWRREHAMARAHCLRHQAAVLSARRAAKELPVTPPASAATTAPPAGQRPWRATTGEWAWRALVLLALLFLCLRAASAQECGVCVVKIQQGGTTVGTAAAPFTLNFATNLAVSKAGSTYTLSASSTAATAWSAITPATNSNTGTFSLGSGVVFAFGSGTINANQYKGGAASGTGACPAGQYAVTLNDGAAPSCLGVTAANIGSLPGTSGQLLFNNGGAIGAEDPVVSGHDATGAAPTANPVYVAGWDGTDVRPILEDTSGHAIVNVNGTVPVSQSGSWTLQGSAANGAVPGGNPVLVAGWDGTDVRTLSTDASGRANVNVNSLPALAAGTNTIGAISNTSFTATQTSGANLHMDVDNFPATQPVSGTVAVSNQPIQPTASAAVNDSASGLTQIVALVAGKAIYVTGYTVVAAGAVTVQWEYGTGTNCGTGTTALTGPMSFAANGGAAPAQMLFVPSGNALCLSLGGAVAVAGSVSYAQQ